VHIRRAILNRRQRRLTTTPFAPDRAAGSCLPARPRAAKLRDAAMDAASVLAMAAHTDAAVGDAADTADFEDYRWAQDMGPPSFTFEDTAVEATATVADTSLHSAAAVGEAMPTTPPAVAAVPMMSPMPPPLPLGGCGTADAGRDGPRHPAAVVTTLALTRSPLGTATTAESSRRSSPRQAPQEGWECPFGPATVAPAGAAAAVPAWTDVHHKVSTQHIYMTLHRWREAGVVPSTQHIDNPQPGQVYVVDKLALKNFRRDGHDWKPRMNSRNPREDHVKLRLHGHFVVYGCYSYSATLPLFQRRTFWLVQSPNIALIHYLNEPIGLGPRSEQPSRAASASPVAAIPPQPLPPNRPAALARRLSYSAGDPSAAPPGPALAATAAAGAAAAPGSVRSRSMSIDGGKLTRKLSLPATPPSPEPQALVPPVRMAAGPEAKALAMPRARTATAVKVEDASRTMGAGASLRPSEAAAKAGLLAPLVMPRMSQAIVVPRASAAVAGSNAATAEALDAPTELRIDEMAPDVIDGRVPAKLLLVGAWPTASTGGDGGLSGAPPASALLAPVLGPPMLGRVGAAGRSTAYWVYFGTRPVAAELVTPTVLCCTAPAMPIGTVHVTVRAFGRSSNAWPLYITGGKASHLTARRPGAPLPTAQPTPAAAAATAAVAGESGDDYSFAVVDERCFQTYLLDALHAWEAEVVSEVRRLSEDGAAAALAAADRPAAAAVDDDDPHQPPSALELQVMRSIVRIMTLSGQEAFRYRFWTMEDERGLTLAHYTCALGYVSRHRRVRARVR